MLDYMKTIKCFDSYWHF